MKIKHHIKDNVYIYEIEGRLDVHGAQMLAKILKGTVAEGSSNIVLDMHRVDYLNTEVLHVLADVRTQSLRQGGDLRIARFSPMVQRVFDVAGFKRFFPNYTSIQAALQGF